VLAKKRGNIGKRLRGDFNHDLQTPAAVLDHGAEAGYNQALRTVDVDLNLGAHVSCAMASRFLASTSKVRWMASMEMTLRDCPTKVEASMEK
jgi:hypothetical protein